MSIEKTRKSLVRKVALLRLAGHLIQAVASLFQSIATSIETLSQSIYLLEADAANRYEDLTGIDLAMVVGREKASYRGALGEQVTYAEDLEEDE